MHEQAASRVRVAAEPWGTRVTLAAPQVRNALDPPSVDLLLDVFRADGAGAVLLAAEGAAFCAGGDVQVLAAAADAGDLAGVLGAGAVAFADLVEAIVTCPRPVVAAIDGPAIGGGVAVALACDLRLATPRARLGLGWGRWGLPPDGGASALLAHAVGAAAARSLLVQGAEIGTDSPFAPALFDRIVEPEALAAASLATVEDLAASAGARVAKRVAAAALLPSLRSQRDVELAALRAAAAEPSVAARLAMIYKIDR